MRAMSAPLREPAREVDASGPPPARARRRAALFGLAALAGVVAFVAWARVHYVLADRNFDAQSADGLLRSDPALVYYMTERIIDGGGLPPADFRADPRVTWPEPADLPAMFTVAQEFPVAWTYLLLGRRVPLHVVALYVMSVSAALAAAGVYGLAFELTRRHRWAVAAALLYATTYWSYRTLGALLIREDLSLPLFAAHLWLAARAARVRTAPAFLWAGLALAGALATWHAMGFVVTLEALALLAWFLRTGESPFDVPRAWIVPAVVAAASIVVPVLASKGFLASPAMLIAAGLVAVPLADLRRAWPAWRRAASGAGAILALFAATRLAGAQQDYAHVTSLMLAKLERLGRFPEDPSTIPFDARLLWQGPFRTGHAADFAQGLAAGSLAVLAALAWAVPGWLRGRGERVPLVLAGVAALGVLSGWLVVRTLVLLDLVAPALAAFLLARLSARRVAAMLAGAAILGQLGHLAWEVARRDGAYVAWYAELPQRNVELARLVRWARENLSPDEPILSDYVTSTALLAHNRNPIVCQPKYETADSRRRIEAFVESYLCGTPADFKALARRYRCRVAVIDRIGNWWLLNTAAGYPMSQRVPPEGTAAAVFGSTDGALLSTVPGYRLLYRAPPREFPGDFYRVYALD
jgi:hypothetical protein